MRVQAENGFPLLSKTKGSEGSKARTQGPRASGVEGGQAGRLGSQLHALRDLLWAAVHGEGPVVVPGTS